MISSVFLYTYVLNGPILLKDCPIIKINFQGELSLEDFTQCEFELESDDPSENFSDLKAKIKIRGGKSGVSIYPKKGYRIELSEIKSLLGMREDDDWILFAMYLDFPRMRIKLAMDLWNSLRPIDPTAILPDSKYVRVYVNGEFHGLYLLAERNDRRLFGLDDAQYNINSSLIFQSKRRFYFNNYQKDHLEQDWPNIDEGIYIIDEIMNDLMIKFPNDIKNYTYVHDPIKHKMVYIPEI